LEFVDNIIADCNQMVQTAKANRAPRKRKEVPAGKQVAKMKYLKDFAELNLKSVNPASIIGSTEAGLQWAKLWVTPTRSDPRD